MLPDCVTDYLESIDKAAKARVNYLRKAAKFPRNHADNLELDDAWQVHQDSTDMMFHDQYEYESYVRKCVRETRDNPLFDPRES